MSCYDSKIFSLTENLTPPDKRILQRWPGNTLDISLSILPEAEMGEKLRGGGGKGKSSGWVEDNQWKYLTYIP